VADPNRPRLGPGLPAETDEALLDAVSSKARDAGGERGGAGSCPLSLFADFYVRILVKGVWLD
jgi:hypothetical protein